MSFCSAQRKLLAEPLFSLEGFPPTYFGTVAISSMPVTLLLRPGSHRAECLVCGASLFKIHGQSPLATLWWPPAYVTTPPSHHIYAFVVAHTQASIQTSLPAATDVLSFANRQLLLHFSSDGSYSFPHPSAAAVAQERAIKLKSKGGTWNSFAPYGAPSEL